MGKGMGRKVLAWMLAAATAASGMGFGPGGTERAYAQEAQAAEAMPEVLAHFSFDEVADEGGNKTFDGTKGVKAAVVKPNDDIVSTTDKKQGIGALKLGNKAYLDVKKADGKGNLLAGKESATISYYSKPTGGDGWSCFIAKDNAKPNWNTETYIGVIDKTNELKVERFENGRDDNTSWSTSRDNKWRRIDVVLESNETRLYIDGDEKKGGSAAKVFSNIVNFETGIFYIGHATWGEEYYEGLIDEFKVYGSALTEDQVKAEYVSGLTIEEKTAYAKKYIDQALPGENGISVNDKALTNVSKNLNPITTIPGGITVAWESSAPDKITNTGEVKVQDGSTVTLTATLKHNNETVATIPYTVQLYADVTVKFMCGTDALKDPVVIKRQAGEEYTYPLGKDERTIEKDGKVYAYDEGSLAVTITAGTPAEITVGYTLQQVASVSPADPITIIEGNSPILPAKLPAKTEEGKQVSVSVSWADKVKVGENDTPLNQLKAGTYTVTGTSYTKAVSAELTVLGCDEALDPVDAANDNNNMIRRLSKVYKGVIVTEFDIVVVDVDRNKDMVMLYSDQADLANNAAGWFNSCGPRIDFGKGDNELKKTPYFRTQSGDGAGNSSGNYPGNDYQNMPEYIKTENGKTYRIRMEIDDASDKGRYRTWITEQDGTTTELFPKDDWCSFRKHSGAGIQNYGAIRDGFKITNHKIYWQSGYATKKIEYLDGDGNQLKDTVISKETPGDQTVQKSSLKTIAVNGKPYMLDDTKSGWYKDNAVDASLEKMAAAEGATVTYKAVYKKVVFERLENPISVETLIGKEPVLPLTVSSKYQDIADPVEESVTWNTSSLDLSSESKQTVNGVLSSGAAVTAEVDVKHAYLMAKYDFEGADDAARQKDKTGKHADAVFKNVEADQAGVDGASKGVKLKGGANDNSNIKLPNDLLQITKADGQKETQNNFTISMFINREDNGNSFAMVLHGSEMGKSSPEPSCHLGMINKDSLFDMEYRNGGTTQTNLKALNADGSNYITPVGQWTHIAIVTDGDSGTAKLYIDGVKRAEKSGVTVKASDLKAQNNYLGRATWNDPGYKAVFDDFSVYNGLLTEAEIQKIAEDRLCKAPVEDIYSRLELLGYAGKEGVELPAFDKDNIVSDLNLQKEMATSSGTAVKGLTIKWSSNNPAIRADGTVLQPSKGKGKKDVTLTAEIQYGSYKKTKEFQVSVKESDKVEFKELKEAIAKAGEIVDTSKDEIYTKATVDILKAKLEAAKTVALKENDPAVTYQEVDGAEQALTAAINGLVPESIENLNGTLLAVWYPLAENAEDASGNQKNGTVKGSIAFSRENGAVLPGRDALSNYISLPTDFEWKDRATISFWAYDEKGGSNAFGIGSGKRLYAEDSTHKGTAAHHISIYTGKGNGLVVNGGKFGWNDTSNIAGMAFAADSWHLVTCVLDGTKAAVYIDGEYQKEGDVGVSLKEAWEKDQAERYAFIGNNVYAYNGDKDYKGRIKDFRIYNAALAAGQVKEIYQYMGTLPMAYAKSDLIKTIGAAEGDDGKYSLNVTKAEISLPVTGAQEEKIEWSSNNDAIKVDETGKATVVLPDNASVTKEAELTAKITLKDGGTETLVIKCSIYIVDATIDVTSLQEAVKKVKELNLKKEDYTTDSWTAYKAALDEAEKQIARPASSQAVADAKAALEDKYAKLAADKTQLKASIDKAAALAEADYTAESWAAVKKALEDADTIYKKAAAAPSEVKKAKTDLDGAVSKLVKKSNPEADAKAQAKAALAATVKTAEEKLKADKKENYTAESWAALEAAVKTAKELPETATAEQIKAADKAVTDAIAGLKPASGGTEKEYTVTFKYDDGGATPDSQVKVKEGQKAAKPKDPARSGYAFAGWYASGASSAYNFDAAVTGNLTLTAKWTPKQVTGTEPDSEEPGTEEPDSEEPGTETPGGDTKKEYTVTFKYDDGGATPDKQVKVAEGQKAAKPADPARSGYTFSGWYASGASSAYNFDTAITGNLTLTAKWTKNETPGGDGKKECTVTFRYDDGATPDKQVKVTEGGKTAEPEEPMREGYVFLGWYKEGAEEAFDFDTAITGDITLTAKWEEDAGGEPDTEEPEKKVQKITASAKSYEVAAGKKMDLSKELTVAPKDAANKKLAYQIPSKYKKYASISSKGVIIAKKAGSITVTVKSADGGASLAVKVKIMKSAVKKISFTAKKKTLEVKAGKSITLKVSIAPKDASRIVLWKSSNTKYASVKAGKVTAKKDGKKKTVTITAAAADGSGKKATIKIKIK